MSAAIRPRLFISVLVLALLLIAGSSWANSGGAFSNDSAFSEALEKGPLYAAGLALLGGLLVSLTPCVYPMIAITVSVFGAKKTESHLHGLGLSAAFVLGIVCMFTPLGVVAGLTGSLFGATLQSPWVLTGIGLLFMAMSASMLGAFELALPSSITNRLAAVGGVGPKGAFGLGLVCGLIAAPCTGPVLTGILTWIAKTQSAGAGALAMSAFSLGLGFPFLLVGTFAVRLPKSGQWMMHIKSVLAIVLAVVALYYLGMAFPFIQSWIKPSPLLYALTAVAAVGGLLIGAVHRQFDSPLMSDKVYKSIGTATTTLSLFILFVAFMTPDRELDWQKIPVERAALAAKAEDQPLLVDFTAAWCGACKELDKLTFADPQVSKEAGRFVAVKVDATDDEDPLVKRTMQAYEVVGLPTVLLFDSSGREVRRFTDFVDAKAFLTALQAVE